MSFAKATNPTGCKHNHNHLKAIAVDQCGLGLLKAANVAQEAGILNSTNVEAFIAAAEIRQWKREKSV